MGDHQVVSLFIDDIPLLIKAITNQIRIFEFAWILKVSQITSLLEISLKQ